MNQNFKTFAAFSLSCIGGYVTAAPLTDDFSNGLGDWNTTVILDAENPGSNTSFFEINASNELQITTTFYDGIEQLSLIRSGAALDVGEEVQVDITVPLPVTRNMGLYVGGTAPMTGVREDYISVYASSINGNIATRGFDGTTEYNNPQSNGSDASTLFLARIDDNTFEAGFYVGETRTVFSTRTPSTPNTADFVGIYADVRATGTIGVISEFRIVALPFEMDLDQGTVFSSGLGSGGGIGSLSIGFGDTPQAASFSLVAGEGDDDNALFQISAGGELQLNADFSSSGLDPANGTEYLVRIRGDIDGSSDFSEEEFVLTLFKDDDNDDLEDEWELRWRSNLTDLDGTGEDDFDNDEIWDIEEYRLSLGIDPNFPGTFPNLDPGNPDTDGDNLLDGQEAAFPRDGRAVTNPTEEDTDFDGLTDEEETNSRIAEVAPFVGTSAALADTDGDGNKDGLEVTNGTDPLDASSFSNPPVAGISVVAISDDDSSEISTEKVYTHAISGGSAVTVNGVAFTALDETNEISNFSWDPDGEQKNSLVAIGADWDPSSGGVTGPSVIGLLTGFTFSGSAIAPGEQQVYTLSGLTPGASYDLRFYIRQWSDADSGRPIDLTFVNGMEEVTPFLTLLADRPGYVLNDPSLNHDQAYFLSYSYVAQETEVSVRAPIPMGFDSDDSFHFYGLTNQDLNAVPVAEIVITGVSQNSSGQVVIDFTGAPSETFVVKKSTDLEDGFVDSAATVSAVTTDGSGVGQAIITAAEASEAAEFYRIEN